MRRYRKYSLLRPAKKSSSWLYWLLAFGALSFLGWLWWQQRLKPTSASRSDQTNDTRAISRPGKLPQTTNPATGALMKSNAPVAHLATNVAETLPRIARPAVSGQTSGVTQILISTPVGPSITNAVPEFATSVRFPKDILEVQIALARQGISSGCIDGKLGSQTRAALRAFQEREHVSPTGDPDAGTKGLLPLLEETFTRYTVTSNDLERLTPIGQTWLAKSQQERLDYETILELVAERGHASPGLLRSLNRGIDWTNTAAGTVITIPNVRYPRPPAKAAFVRIRLAEKTLQAFDPETNLLAHFPCSIARRVEKRPVGELFVEKLAPNPNYRFDPEVFPESAEARELGRVLMIPAGPNNPVGTAWIGLNRPGYGIHGTPRPEEVGRTESHGCFRLANWNAEYLLQLVSIGTPVLVEP